MGELDRREFLARAAAAACALGGAGALVRDAPGAVEPRLRALARELRGPVLTPGDAAYARARLVYNERFDAVRPLAVVQAASAADVQATVRWARRNDVRLAARSGGHSYAGYSTTTGVVVDLRRLDRIALHPDGTATIGAGAPLVDVQAALARRGRAIPTGSCPTVGIAGLALGGGVGLASRAWGTTSDNVVSLGIVTADGRRLTCDRTRNRGLYWACRGGGGGNFGIVTHLVLRTHAAPPVSYVFGRWPWASAADVLRAWQRFVPGQPDALTTICTLGTGATAPAVTVLGQLLGPEARLRKLMTPLARIDGASLSFGSSSYLDAPLRWAGCLGKSFDECRAYARASFHAKSDYLAKPLGSAGGAQAVAAIERAQAARFGSAALIFDSYGGALNRVRPGATAFVHRDALCSVQYLGYWYGPAGAAGAGTWIRGAHAALRPHVSGFAYQNYIDRELATWRHAYYGANYERLRAVKRAVDPDWFFRFPQAIEPAAR